MPKTSAPRAQKPVKMHEHLYIGPKDQESFTSAGVMYNRNSGKQQMVVHNTVHPHCHVLVDVSCLFQDIHAIPTISEQVEKCTVTAMDLCRDPTAAKAEYRHRYKTLLQTDRADMKARSDSGSKEAVKQWQQFCEDTLTLMAMRNLLFQKGIEYHIMSDNLGIRAGKQTVADVLEHGKLTYVTCAQVEGGRDVQGEVVLKSESLGTQLIAIDMSQWVRKSTQLPINNYHLQQYMAAIRMTHAADLKEAEVKYQLIWREIRDADAEQLANMAEAGITQHAFDNYKTFWTQCVQVVTLWHIIHNKPVPISLSVPESSRRTYSTFIFNK